MKVKGIRSVKPIASILRKQKNSLKPRPVKAANRGPIASTERGLLLKFETISINHN